MRLKLSLLAPFPSIKVLLPVPEHVKTVIHLKRHIRQSLSVVHELTGSSRDVVLEIEGFELLGGSEMDVIENGDVVCVRLRAEGSGSTTKAAKHSSHPEERVKLDDKSSSGDKHSPSGRKRKARSQEPVPATKPSKLPRKQDRRVTEPARVPIKAVAPAQKAVAPASAVIQAAPVAKPANPIEEDASSSSSSSSESDSESESDDDSDSDSTSDSSSSSSSSSSATSSAPSEVIKPSHPKPSIPARFPSIPPNLLATLHQQKPHTPPQRVAPPGEGNASTRERNQRRRKARKARQLAAVGISLGRTPSAVGDALGDQSSTSVLAGQVSTTTTTTPLLPLPNKMNGMANRNKKRGFLKHMAGVKGSKTVFEAAANGVGSVEPTEQEAIVDGVGAVEPNDKVTMTGIDGGIHSIEPATPSRYQRVVPPSEQDLPSNVFVTHVEYPRANRGRPNGRAVVEDTLEDENAEEGDEEEEEEEVVQEDSPTFEEEQSNQVLSNPKAEDIWHQAERDFNLLPPLSAGNIPAEGSIIAWRAIELDMMTFTPELRIQLGRIISHGEAGTKVEKLQRESDVELGMEMEEREVLISPKELEERAGEWKIVKHAMRA